MPLIRGCKVVVTYPDGTVERYEGIGVLPVVTELRGEPRGAGTHRRIDLSCPEAKRVSRVAPPPPRTEAAS